MKKIIMIMVLSLGSLTISVRTEAQSIDQLLEQLFLDIQKLSALKGILNDLYKSYQILDKGYSDIKSIAQGNFSLHKAFLDGLLAVSPTVRKFPRIIDIINSQSTIVSEYSSAYNKFKADGHFSVAELQFIGSLYNTLFNHGIKNLEELTIVITAGEARMTDAERLNSINKIYADVTKDLYDMRSFNNSTFILGIQRAKALNDLNTLKTIYGISK